MRYLKNQKILDKFGKRLASFRHAADLSQEMVHLITGMAQSHIAQTENGQVNTNLSHLAAYAELYGVPEHELLFFEQPVPEPHILKKNVTKYLKQKGLDPKVFLKENIGATQLLIKIIQDTKFLSTPRFAKEVANYCHEKYNTDFTTSQLSKTLDTLVKRKILERVATSNRNRLKYQKKG